MTAENRLTEIQSRRNADSADTWQLAEPHRNRVTQQIVERRCDAHPQLCVLGAGNCNDLDLTRLVEAFDRVDLFDIDLAAMQRGMAAQACDGNNSVQLHGGCDVTGVWQELAALADQSEKPAEAVDELIAKSNEWPGLSEAGTYGTVASVCLLSQLIDGVIQSMGEAHPRCLEIIEAIRLRHLRLLSELTAPGGSAILITDFVSSDTAPTLPSLAGPALSSTLMQMVKQQNFFTGLNPFRLQVVIRDDPVLANQVQAMHCQEPWLWNFGPRHYAVTAISFQRS